MKKVYISGPITGIENYRTNFNDAFIKLAKLKYRPVDPCTIKHNHNKSYESYMKEDLKALLDCDCIYMLPGWRKSKGACFELETAVICGIKEIFID